MPPLPRPPLFPYTTLFRSVARRAALIDARRQRPHLGDLVGDLLPHEMSAQPDLAALADEDLDRVGQPQVVRVEPRSEEHTSELQSRLHLVCRLLLEKKKKK